MTIPDESALAAMRGAGPCEWCGRWCDLREAAHVFARGRGDANRLDISLNLVALGRGAWFDGWERCGCHRSHHAGHEPTKLDLLTVACARENVLQRDALAVIYLLLRLPRDARPWQVDEAMNQSVVEGEGGNVVGMNDGQRALVTRYLGGRA